MLKIVGSKPYVQPAVNSSFYYLTGALENRHRKNAHIEQFWADLELRICSHFYHVGSSEDYRNAMDEALLIKPGFASPDHGKQHTRKARPAAAVQAALLLE